jgi:hypothetical protein
VVTLHFCLAFCLSSTLASEPASILYILTGAAGFAYAKIRKSTRPSDAPSTPMLFCRRDSHARLKSLRLLQHRDH